MEKINLAVTPETKGVEKVIGEIRAGHIGDRYPRNRPFLVITPIGNVARETRKNGAVRFSSVTSKKGWTNDPSNWDVNERSEIVLRVSNRMLQEASVIIDIVNTKLEKNRYGAVQDDEVMAHYMGRYAQDITEALKNWADALKEAIGIEIDTNVEEEEVVNEGAPE